MALCKVLNSTGVDLGDTGLLQQVFCGYKLQQDSPLLPKANGA